MALRGNRQGGHSRPSSRNAQGRRVSQASQTPQTSQRARRSARAAQSNASPRRARTRTARNAARRQPEVSADSPAVSQQVPSGPAAKRSIRAIPGTKREAGAAEDSAELVSSSVGEIKRKGRSEELKATSRRYFRIFTVIIVLVVVALAAWAALYNSTAFTITNVKVVGVEHLTNDEMTQLANVPQDSTLLRVDTESIINRVKQSSWVEDVQVNRIPPDTLEIRVTERPVAAIVEIPNSDGGSIKQWAIATDHMWLMPIPDINSEAAQTTNPKIYEDVETVRHITGVPIGTQAEIGKYCTDEVVENVLAIFDGMTTDLVSQIVEVSAPSVAETTLVLDSGLEIAFGKAEDIRDKERVVENILAQNPDGVSYINVRMVETPTWRSI